MKILTLITLFLLLSATMVFGKSRKSTLELLQSQTWVEETPRFKYGTFELKFTASQQKMTLILENGEKNEIRMMYYLSNEPVTTFLSNKMGKVKKGKYIIAQRSEVDKDGKRKKTLVCFEITELTESRLNLKSLDNEWTSIFIPKAKPGSATKK